MSRNKKINSILAVGIFGVANFLLFQNCSRIQVQDLQPALTNISDFGGGENSIPDSIEPATEQMIPTGSNPISNPAINTPNLTSGSIPGTATTVSTTVIDSWSDAQTIECDGELEVINWYKTLALSDAPQKFFVGQTADFIAVGRVNYTNIIGNSARIIEISAAERALEIVGNSANIRGNIRQVGFVSGNSGNLDINAQSINDVIGSSAEHICLRARNIGSVKGGNTAELSIVNNFTSDVAMPAALGTVSLIQGNSAKKVVVVDMTVSAIEGGSGSIYIQNGHVSVIRGQSGDIYLDNVTVDAVLNSSGKIHLRNGAKVMNSN